jgi:hypothetical protein
MMAMTTKSSIKVKPRAGIPARRRAELKIELPTDEPVRLTKVDPICIFMD